MQKPKNMIIGITMQNYYLIFITLLLSQLESLQIFNFLKRNGKF